MTVWAVIFMGVAALAAVFGFSGLAPAIAGAAQFLCFVFLGLAGAALALRGLETLGARAASSLSAPDT